VIKSRQVDEAGASPRNGVHVSTQTVESTDTETDGSAYPLGHVKGIVGFRRVIQVRPYETAEAKVDLEVQLDLGVDGTEVIAALNDAFFQAKAVVFDQLGIDFELGENGVAVELLRKEFGGGELAPASASPAPSSPPALTVVSNDTTSATTPPFSGDTKDTAEKRANKEWAIARLESNPDEFSSRRASASGTTEPNHLGQAGTSSITRAPGRFPT
jgi:hypothetical protein